MALGLPPIVQQLLQHQIGQAGPIVDRVVGGPQQPVHPLLGLVQKLAAHQAGRPRKPHGFYGNPGGHVRRIPPRQPVGLDPNSVPASVLNALDRAQQEQVAAQIVNRELARLGLLPQPSPIAGGGVAFE